MRIRNNKSGFSAIELVIVVVIVGVLGFVGFSVYNRQQTKTADNGTEQSSEQSATANDVQAAPQIKSTSDLDKASAALDKTNPEGSNKTDSAQLDNETSAF